MCDIPPFFLSFCWPSPGLWFFGAVFRLFLHFFFHMTLRHRHLACVGVSLNFGTRVVIPSFAVAPQPPPPFYLSHPAHTAVGNGVKRSAVRVVRHISVERQWLCHADGQIVRGSSGRRLDAAVFFCAGSGPVFVAVQLPL
jgi:hypothetical protein